MMTWQNDFVIIRLNHLVFSIENYWACLFTLHPESCKSLSQRRCSIFINWFFNNHIQLFAVVFPIALDWSTKIIMIYITTVLKWLCGGTTISIA